jgi:hypothetical protein
MIAIVVVLGAVFALGLFAGIRYQEINLEGRERRLARGRRDLAARADALDAYAGVSRMIFDARHHIERDAMRRHDIPLVVVPDPDDRAS